MDPNSDSEPKARPCASSDVGYVGSDVGIIAIQQGHLALVVALKSLLSTGLGRKCPAALWQHPGPC